MRLLLLFSIVSLAAAISYPMILWHTNGGTSDLISLDIDTAEIQLLINGILTGMHSTDAFFGSAHSFYVPEAEMLYTSTWRVGNPTTLFAMDLASKDLELVVNMKVSQALLGYDLDEGILWSRMSNGSYYPSDFYFLAVDPATFNVLFSTNIQVPVLLQKHYVIGAIYNPSTKQTVVLFQSYTEDWYLGTFDPSTGKMTHLVTIARDSPFVINDVYLLQGVISSIGEPGITFGLAQYATSNGYEYQVIMIDIKSGTQTILPPVTVDGFTYPYNSLAIDTCNKRIVAVVSPPQSQNKNAHLVYWNYEDNTVSLGPVLASSYNNFYSSMTFFQQC